MEEQLPTFLELGIVTTDHSVGVMRIINEVKPKWMGSKARRLGLYVIYNDLRDVLYGVSCLAAAKATVRVAINMEKAADTGMPGMVMESFWIAYVNHRHFSK